MAWAQIAVARVRRVRRRHGATGWTGLGWAGMRACVRCFMYVCMYVGTFIGR